MKLLSVVVGFAVALSLFTPCLAAESQFVEVQWPVERPEMDIKPIHTAHELRMAAPLQVLSRTDDPQRWILQGTADLENWTHLGEFFAKDGILGIEHSPPLFADEPVPMRFVVGTLILRDGSEVENVVASVANVGMAPSLPDGSLLFVVHQLASSEKLASNQARASAAVAASIPGIAVGYRSKGTIPSVKEPNKVFDQAVGDGCRANCEAASDIKLTQCGSSYTNCVALATSAYFLCNLSCGPTGGLGCLACAGAYYLSLAYCDSEYQGCTTSVRADRQACVNNCPVAPEDPPNPPEEPISPIVLNLDGRQGFRFTSASEGVSFDLDADGHLNQTAWTEPGYEQSFLVFDRNGNGTIDDGSEMFGEVTPQPLSDSPNGFLALGVFDMELAGGNGDGMISEEDLVFPSLSVWKDENHDGVSQSWELTSLAAAGVESIRLDYVTSNRRDRHGNLLRYKALVRMTDQRVVECIDVLFAQVGAE